MISDVRAAKVRLVVDRYVTDRRLEEARESDREQATEFALEIVEALPEPFSVQDVAACLRLTLDWPEVRPLVPNGYGATVHERDPFDALILCRELFRELLDRQAIACVRPHGGRRRALYVRFPRTS